MNRPLSSAELIKQLVSALEAADLYLNSYDVSAPSRIKADTRLAVEDALGAVKASLAPTVAPETITAGDAASAELPSPAHAEREAERQYLTKLVGKRTLVSH